MLRGTTGVMCKHVRTAVVSIYEKYRNKSSKMCVLFFKLQIVVMFGLVKGLYRTQ